MYLHVHKSDATDQWYVRLVGANGEVMMFSEMYFDKANAERAAANMQANWPDMIDIRIDDTES